MIEVHQEQMTTRDKKEARRIVEGIEFEQATRPNAARPPRGNENMAAPPRSNRRDAFGAQLSTPASFPALPSTRPEPSTASKEPELLTLFELNNPDQATLK
jgi:hypothetical protein